MKKNKALFLLLILPIFTSGLEFYLPIDVKNRRILKSSYITSVGEFGILRKSYNNIPSHFHSGIDIMNPGKKPGEINPVFACAEGKVISVLKNKSSSNVIIKHNLNDGRTIYSTYTHIVDIVVEPGDTVNHFSVIASFIDSEKLDKWGEYLDHLHFEILKIPPKFIGIRDNRQTYLSYSIDCKQIEELFEKFYNPILFFIYINN